MNFNLTNLLFILLLHAVSFTASAYTPIRYNGFKSANLTVDGMTLITSNGLLRLTNGTTMDTGHAFYPDPIPFKPSKNNSVVSFSTTFVYRITSQFPGLAGHGLVFVIAPAKELPYSSAKEYLGLFNNTNDGSNSNRVIGVEIDTIKDLDVGDINNNHVGIDINSVQSVASFPAS